MRRADTARPSARPPPPTLPHVAAGLEYAEAECVVDCRQRGTMRKYLVK